MNQPLVYIILVNYNGIDDTIECLNSLHKIQYENYSIVVVDNASSDNSVKILNEKFNTEKIEIISLNSNNGFASGNNVGIKKALDHNADYVLLLNNDTLVEPDFLMPLIDAFENNENVGAVAPIMLYETDRNRIWYAGGKVDLFTANTSHYGYDLYLNSFKPQAGEVSFITGCCMCLSSNLIKTIGLLDETYFLYEEDTDYCLKMMLNGFKLYFEPKSCIYHKVSASTAKKPGMIQYYMVRNKLLLIKRHIHGYKKTFSYSYTFVKFMKRIIFKELLFSYSFYGFIDFVNNKYGKNKKKFN